MYMRPICVCVCVCGCYNAMISNKYNNTIQRYLIICFIIHVEIGSRVPLLVFNDIDRELFYQTKR